MATIRPFINGCKKRAVFAALVTLIAAAPAWARVDISCAQVGDTNEVIISFDASSELNLIRAFALDIRLDNDANIVEVAALNPDYYIYPGTIQIDAFGNVIDYGTVLAEYSNLPSGTLPGLDSNGVTIEMASLYAPVGPGSPNAPATSGDLLSLKVSRDVACITISGNVARAGPTGVVMEDPDQIVEVNISTSCCVHHCIGCYCGQPDYAEWDAVGKPASWCYPRQCHGDSDDMMEGSPFTGYYYVGISDLSALIDAWKVLEPPDGPGLTIDQLKADFNHLKEGSPFTGYYRVGVADLTILIANWKILEPAVFPIPSGPGISADCLH